MRACMVQYIKRCRRRGYIVNHQSRFLRTCVSYSFRGRGPWCSEELWQALYRERNIKERCFSV